MATTKAKEVKEEIVEENPVEDLEPQVETKIIVLGEGEDRLTYEQKPLSFFGKIEFFSVMGKAVERVLSDGGSIADILDVKDTSPNVLNSQTNEADTFVKAVSKLIQFAPEILQDLYCVILAVPRNEREYVKIRLEEDLDDEQGFAILELFVDQNWEVMASFFKKRILPLYEKINQKFRS